MGACDDLESLGEAPVAVRGQVPGAVASIGGKEGLEGDAKDGTCGHSGGLSCILRTMAAWPATLVAIPVDP